jgi:hypothetical protein
MVASDVVIAAIALERIVDHKNVAAPSYVYKHDDPTSLGNAGNDVGFLG